jgi:hypothetical protein
MIFLTFMVKILPYNGAFFNDTRHNRYLSGGGGGGIGGIVCINSKSASGEFRFANTVPVSPRRGHRPSEDINSIWNSLSFIQDPFASELS